MASRKYLPLPRYAHTSAQVANNVIVYSGRTPDIPVQSSKRLASIVEVFHPNNEEWEAKQTAGETPAPGTYYAASIMSKGVLFTYGGKDGDGKFLDVLHQLRTKTYKWRKLIPKNAKAESPMPKAGAAMVAYGDHLALFGGFGLPRSSTHRGSSFIDHVAWSDGRGWTNEFHIYHRNEGTHTTRICSIPLVCLLFVV